MHTVLSLLLLVGVSLTACASPPPAPAVDNYRPLTRSDQLEEVRTALARYRDFAVAEREGWKPFGGDEPLMGRHYYNEDAPDYVAGDPLDFSRPNNLMYTDIGGRMVLTGAAFVVRLGEGEAVPEGFAGAEDRWHVHDFVAAVEVATEERPVLGWLANRWLDDNYRSGGDERGRLAMVHAWVTLSNPDGVFADHNRTLPYRKLGLPSGSWQGASERAARGLNLATIGGCEAMDGRLWIADVTGRQKRAIRAACRSSAEIVGAALASRDTGMINHAGERAWTEFDAVWQRVLSVEQKARVAAMSEHGSSGPDHGHRMHTDRTGSFSR